MLLLRLGADHCQSDSKLSTLLASQPLNPAASPKLLLAHSNPHLKSHRRRQSSLIPADNGTAVKNMNLPGQVIPGMEHTKQLADLLYGKWAEGLMSRWPALS